MMVMMRVSCANKVDAVISDDAPSLPYSITNAELLLLDADDDAIPIPIM